MIDIDNNLEPAEQTFKEGTNIQAHASNQLLSYLPRTIIAVLHFIVGHKKINIPKLK